MLSSQISRRSKKTPLVVFLVMFVYWFFGFTFIHSAAQTHSLFNSDGSSLAPFVNVGGNIGPGTASSDGKPAPSIEWVGRYGLHGAVAAPYTWPGLSGSQIIHATADIKVGGLNSYPYVSFGTLGGTTDTSGRLPMPYIMYLSNYAAMMVCRTDVPGAGETCDLFPYTMPIDAWVTLDFTLTPFADGYYHCVLKMDGTEIGTFRSNEPIMPNEQLGVLIGIGSGYNQDIVRFDNIKVEVLGTLNPPTPIIKSRIVYMSNQTGTNEIWIMNDDGTGKTQLTFNSGSGGSGEPKFSPDGRHIAYYRPCGLYVMNADGTNQTLIRDLGGPADLYSWSKSGWLYYSNYYGLHRVRPDGSRDTQLADNYALGASESPDGKRVVYELWHYGWTPLNETHLIDLETGTDTTIIPIDGQAEYYASYAHTSNKVLYEQADSARGFDSPANIWIMNDDGSDRVSLTHAADNVQFEWPSYSPDDTKFACMRYRRGEEKKDIVVKNSDGSGLTVLTDPTYWATCPDWGRASNGMPIANAGPDQTAVVTAECSAPVTLDGTQSSDPDGDILTYTWTGLFGTATGPTPTVTLPKGSHSITVMVADGKGGAASDTTVVTVIDTTPPNINLLSATPSVLWPANHKMVPVSITGVASDNCGPTPVAKIMGVSSNEAINRPGDGNTAPDYQITGNLTLDLRAERSGTGSGRIYTVTVQATDASGNGSTKTVTITVPHDRGN
jgi:hypothetical protein